MLIAMLTQNVPYVLNAIFTRSLGLIFFFPSSDYSPWVYLSLKANSAERIENEVHDAIVQNITN